MSNYGYTNEYGEPIMDGAAYRYEQYLDSTYEPDPDDFYDRWDEPEDVDPSECDHPDRSYHARREVECDVCYATGAVIVYVDIDETDESIVDVIVWNI